MKILQPTDEAVLGAAKALRAGELIGFPTETVYGIAASATNVAAVLKTFELKKRPPENPLIVHVASLERASELVTSIPDAARKLAAFYWPGPLTLVLPKTSKVPDEVTGGLDTVAIRVPFHPVAQVILHASGLPLTAPSANPFMGLSPTRAENIVPEILEGLACVIDGGPCDVGVESTVVDCSGSQVVILRPGGISRILIEAALGFEVSIISTDNHRSPGMYKRHYSPKTPIQLVDVLGPYDAGITFRSARNDRQIKLPDDPTEYARDLYAALYTLDQLGCPELMIQMPPDTMEWEAVWDRLEKAASTKSEL